MREVWNDLEFSTQKYYTELYICWLERYPEHASEMAKGFKECYQEKLFEIGEEN